MTLPLKPDVCITGDRLAIFIGAGYMELTLADADKWVPRVQSALAKLRRQEKRKARDARKAGAA